MIKVDTPEEAEFLAGLLHAKPVQGKTVTAVVDELTDVGVQIECDHSFNVNELKQYQASSMSILNGSFCIAAFDSLQNVSGHCSDLACTCVSLFTD